MDIKEEDYSFEESRDIIERYLGISTKLFLVAVTFVILIGIYIGVILYGKNSVNVLLRLQTYETFLKQDIQRLKDENAELQKEYFELKEISGYTEKR
jgi:cell division protein FtsB